MDLVASLMNISNEKKISLENLEKLHKEDYIDETTYNQLVESVRVDFERKKKDLMEPAVLDTSPSVITITSPTPVSAMKAPNTVVTVIDVDENDKLSSAKPKRCVNGIASFFQTPVSICSSKSKSIGW
jgi:hypothetical protein